MKYGGDKIKLVTDDLSKGDNLQVLGFDTCGFALIGKWKNEYGTYGDPLISDEVPCGLEGNCPICQEKITNVKDLPGWPEPCSNGDAFLMMSQSGKLKTMCKSALEDNDKKVAVSSGDNTPGYLRDKLVVCDSDGPLSFTEITSGNSHQYCLGWDPSEANIDFTDLGDTPSSYPSKTSILYSNGNSISYFTPTVCEGEEYSYVAYDKNGGLVSKCNPFNISCCYWEYSGGAAYVPSDADGALYYLRNNPSAVIPNNQTFSGGVSKFKATDDIVLANGDSDIIFVIKRPGVYQINYGCTMHNQTNAGLQAIRSCLLVGEYKLESKYDSRKYTQYVNDFLPDEYNSDYEGGERNLELAIMSFSNSSVVVLESAASVQFRLGVSRQLNDHRMKTQPELNEITLKVTSGADLGGVTYVSAVRIGDVPTTYKNRI